jgi:two-component system sensor histidine kinase HydH
LLRYRLIDLYELAGRLAVLTAVSFALATIIWLLVHFAGERFFLQAVVAALVVLLLSDPLLQKVEAQIALLFFSERHAFESTVLQLKRRLANILELDHMTQVVLEGLEASRRVTHAAIYLVDEDMQSYALMGHVGPPPVPRIERLAARPFLERLQRRDTLLVEPLESELDSRRARGEERDAETLHEILQTLDAMQASVCIALRGDGGLYGVLCLKDERLKDAFSPEEVQLLLGLAVQVVVAIENSRLYRRLRERDRLAALGELAAGLAHEIRNPLGAIKASAQYLSEASHDGAAAGEERPHNEFLDIIVDEVDRLNRVVTSILDYARPQPGSPAPVDVNAAIARTLQLMATDQEAGISFKLALAADLPAVRIDVEQLRQVLINLLRNAIQAMDGRGTITIETAVAERNEVDEAPERWVELRVSDTGPGVPKKVLDALFEPFVTTKERGTGLGLAISQRIVQAVGGRIDVRSHEGVGSTFLIRLPASQTHALPRPDDVSARQTAAQGMDEGAGTRFPASGTGEGPGAAAAPPASSASSGSA